MRSQTSTQKDLIISTAPTSAESVSNQMKDLRKLFVEELKDIYWAEKSLTALLPRIVDKVSCEELADGILDQLALTLHHITRLEAVFISININTEATKCETMAALAREAEVIITAKSSAITKDADIWSVVKKIQHYEIVSYGILCAFSKALGEIEALSLMEDTLTEEREIYKTMHHIGSYLNTISEQEPVYSYKE